MSDAALDPDGAALRADASPSRSTSSGSSSGRGTGRRPGTAGGAVALGLADGQPVSDDRAVPGFAAFSVEVPLPADHLLLGRLADRAGVDHDEVRRLLVRASAQPAASRRRPSPRSRCGSSGSRVSRREARQRRGLGPDSESRGWRPQRGPPARRPAGPSTSSTGSAGRPGERHCAVREGPGVATGPSSAAGPRVHAPDAARGRVSTSIRLPSTTVLMAEPTRTEHRHRRGPELGAVRGRGRWRSSRSWPRPDRLDLDVWR